MTFLAGYLVSRRSGIENPNQRALIDNSLIDRFQKQPAKYAQPTGPFALSEKEVSSQTVTGDGKGMFYYDSKSGQIRSVLFQNSGGYTLILTIPPNAEQISWALNKTLVATYKTGVIYYDLSSGFSKKLDPQTINPVLSRSGDKLAFDYFDTSTGTGEIRITDPKSGGYKKVMPTLFRDYQMRWLGDAKLSLIKTPTQDNPTFWLFVLDTETGRLQRLLDSKTDLWIRWSPNGQKLIYSYADPSTSKKTLYLMNLSDLEEIRLADASEISDCVWSVDNKTIYCANKDSFFTVDTSSSDMILKNINTPFKGNIGSFANGATSLILSSSEGYLIFKSSDSGKLYALPLD